MNNAKTEYFATESYHICRSSAYSDEHDSFILYKAREKSLVEEYKGWYLRFSKSKCSPTCYEYYKVIKNILNGEVNGINQEIKEIRVVLSDNFIVKTITSEWPEEEILKELSKCFWKD